MITVCFHEIDEFLEELDRHADDDAVVIERDTIRATPLYTHLPTGLRRVSVVGTFVSLQAPYAADPPSTELVRVDAFAGDLWGHEERDQQTLDRRDALLSAIRGAAERLGLDVRPGVYGAVAR